MLDLFTSEVILEKAGVLWNPDGLIEFCPGYEPLPLSGLANRAACGCWKRPPLHGCILLFISADQLTRPKQNPISLAVQLLLMAPEVDHLQLQIPTLINIEFEP